MVTDLPTRPTTIQPCQIVVPKKRIINDSLEEALTVSIKTHKDIIPMAIKLRQEQLEKISSWHLERQKLLERCVKVLESAIKDGEDEKKIELMHLEAEGRLYEFDLLIISRYISLAEEQSTALRNVGLDLLKPAPLSPKDLTYNRTIMKILIINHA